MTTRAQEDATRTDDDAMSHSLRVNGGVVGLPPNPTRTRSHSPTHTPHTVKTSSLPPVARVTLAARVITLNVGGIVYNTTYATIIKERESTLAVFVHDTIGTEVDDANIERHTTQGIVQLDERSYFLDRDGDLFRYVLDYMRTGKVALPDRFDEMGRLREEVRFYAMPTMLKLLGRARKSSNTPPTTTTRAINGAENDVVEYGGHVTVGYRGTFAFGRDGQADVKFRKLSRLLVSGKAALCRDVFGDSLNESRDPDREGAQRYTSRLYLKHQNIEKAFDVLAAKGYVLVSSTSSGANGACSTIHHQHSGGHSPMQSTSDMNTRSSADFEEQRWQRYVEYVFYRRPHD